MATHSVMRDPNVQNPTLTKSSRGVLACLLLRSSCVIVDISRSTRVLKPLRFSGGWSNRLRIRAAISDVGQLPSP